MIPPPSAGSDAPANSKRVVGVDLGSRRIGIAASDSGGSLAFPWGIVERSGDQPTDHRRIAEVVAELGAGTVVVGLPLSLDGRSRAAAQGASEEASSLRSVLDGVEVETFDERLTTVTAQAALASAGTRGRAVRRKIDSAAATVLLQAWLDAR
jgi:putative Holliday junction resolvase